MRRPKFEPGAFVKANDKAPGDYQGREGVVFERGPGKAEYGVRFQGVPAFGYLQSAWLDGAFPEDVSNPRREGL